MVWLCDAFDDPDQLTVIPIAAASAAIGSSMARNKKRFACLASLASHSTTADATNQEVCTTASLPSFERVISRSQ